MKVEIISDTHGLLRPEVKANKGRNDRNGNMVL